jgi:hypothetical protein
VAFKIKSVFGFFWTILYILYIFDYGFVIYDSLQISKTFPTYEDVLIFIDLLAEEKSFPLRIYDSIEVSEYNK